MDERNTVAVNADVEPAEDRGDWYLKATNEAEATAEGV